MLLTEIKKYVDNGNDVNGLAKALYEAWDVNGEYGMTEVFKGMGMDATDDDCVEMLDWIPEDVEPSMESMKDMLHLVADSKAELKEQYLAIKAQMKELDEKLFWITTNLKD